MALMKAVKSYVTDADKESSADRKPNNLRSLADRERDAGNWDNAATLYLEHLNSEPGDFQIWVQRGNCLKEAGDFAPAEEAYRSAITLKPDDADVHLQLGHLMKRMGQLAASIECYHRSLELDPTQRHALRELKALGVHVTYLENIRRSEWRRPAGPVVYYDIFDLIQFLREHVRVTGIQRVVIELIYCLLKNDKLSETIAFCAVTTEVSGQFTFGSDDLVIFEPNALRDLVSCLGSPWMTRQILDEQLITLLNSQVAREIRSGDVYVILGAFWIVQDYGAPLLRMKEKGALVCTYIYDLIPITHPQFVTEVTRGDTINRFYDVLQLSDFLLAISEYSAHETCKLLHAELNTEKPVYAVPLAHEQPKPAGGTPGVSARIISEELRALAEQPFVMTVCTLEGRKNHLLLYRAWAAMVRKHGFGKVPQLILVGKWGWRVDEFRDACESSNFLNGKINVKSDLRDDELSYLYERCMFTIFPSFAEGWGLAVGESLAFGKACLASNATSIPEVGGDLVAYFDPHDVFAATQLIEKAIFNGEYLSSLASRIKAEFRPRTWEDVTTSLVERISQSAEALNYARSADPTKYQPRIPIEPGRLYKISGDTLVSREEIPWAQKLIRLVRRSGWYGLEHWGSWSSKHRAQLRLNVGAEHASEETSVYLELRLPPNGGDKCVGVSDGIGNSMTLTCLSESPKWVKCKAAVNADGFLNIFIERSLAGTKVDDIEPRQLHVGLSGFGYHWTADQDARLDIIENLLLATGALCDR